MSNNTPAHIEKIISAQAKTGKGKDLMRLQILTSFDYEESEFERIWEANAPKPKVRDVLARFVAMALICTMGHAFASSACLEKDKEHAKVTDTEGKVHRLTLFILGEEDEAEYTEFLNGRKTAAMNTDGDLHVKAGTDAKGQPVIKIFKAVPDCPEKVRKALKL